jgi:hypothetical protein
MAPAVNAQLHNSRVEDTRAFISLTSQQSRPLVLRLASLPRLPNGTVGTPTLPGYGCVTTAYRLGIDAWGTLHADSGN